ASARSAHGSSRHRLPRRLAACLLGVVTGPLRWSGPKIAVEGSLKSARLHRYGPLARFSQPAGDNSRQFERVAPAIMPPGCRVVGNEQEEPGMKALLFNVWLSLAIVSTAAAADGLKCDMTQYKESGGLTASVGQDALEVTWAGQNGAEV